MPLVRAQFQKYDRLAVHRQLLQFFPKYPVRLRNFARKIFLLGCRVYEVRMAYRAAKLLESKRLEIFGKCIELRLIEIEFIAKFCEIGWKFFLDFFLHEFIVEVIHF